MLGALVLAVGLVVPPSLQKPAVHPAAPLAFVLRVLGYAAHDVGLDIRLLRAVARHESGYISNAVSKTGAVGVLQLEPATALENGCTDTFDARSNVYGGARYLARLLKRYRGDVRLAVAAYNAGPAAVDRFGGVPPYAETKAYVASVLADLES